MNSRRPRGFWPATIRRAMSALGGECPLTDAYDWIAAHVDLSERELSESPHEGRLNFVHTVRGVADDMVKRGELIRPERGRFRLPD